MGGVLGSRIFLRAKNIDKNQPGVKTRSHGRLRVYRMGSTTGVSYGGRHRWVQRAHSKRSLLCSCQALIYATVCNIHNSLGKWVLRPKEVRQPRLSV